MQAYIDEWFQTSAPSIQLEENMLVLYPSFLPSNLADHALNTLITDIPWQQHSLKIYGRRIPFPRLMYWMGQPGTAYRFSGNEFQPHPWHPVVLTIKSLIEQNLPASFNSVLLNLYRHGRDSMSWHADDETCLGPTPTIASISLGSTRHFAWKPKFVKGPSRRIPLPHGSLLIMKGQFQHHYLHALPKTSQPKGCRINLTFRNIVQ
ncbi:alpha-ketoglutarate-dependent dioxygenase AlkB family protein [Schleiferia thermophila]|jgi:alkylated DNA repair dioxygenase AlkB|uniref:alpha-ketoglutarate-dependent dioxygenase AlkB family protein n=1 Tax=Schleiferia thermophila TaxID=884107 RepID=UPI0004E73E79|nr:alpha-ketoglutarate-dependent dioxygenase AlkB [Schleiferia thermophila]KFD38442.1 hypothetical protein AT05_10125 [Schleiferia thermophila str. Yellowstone]